MLRRFVAAPRARSWNPRRCRAARSTLGRRAASGRIQFEFEVARRRSRESDGDRRDLKVRGLTHGRRARRQGRPARAVPPRRRTVPVAVDRRAHREGARRSSGVELVTSDAHGGSRRPLQRSSWRAPGGPVERLMWRAGSCRAHSAKPRVELGRLIAPQPLGHLCLADGVEQTLPLQRRASRQERRNTARTWRTVASESPWAFKSRR